LPTFTKILGRPIEAKLTFLLMVCSAIAACRRSGALQLHDTEAREFTASLEGPDVSQLKLSPAPEASSRFELRRGGHLVAACPLLDGSVKVPITQCRALVCKADTECPPAHGLKQGTCINGLCIEPSQNLIADDAIVLCLAGTGADYASPAQIERYALGLNCGQPCRVPTPCRQP
jgi:hypothetical protein